MGLALLIVSAQVALQEQQAMERAIMGNMPYGVSVLQYILIGPSYFNPSLLISLCSNPFYHPFCLPRKWMSPDLIYSQWMMMEVTKVMCMFSLQLN